MANTIMTAKNTFAEGLVMDFAPDNTQATTLTSALNATLLTFNGNEMSLLNDMGNGRVETAYLPEGYVPVGTCEFGDIIYIVSYNPLINKSLIGCFPSPERNISSLEIGGLNQSIKWTDFQKSNGYEPSGELVASSIKKILYKSKDMTSGDKYIIYSNEIDNEGRYLSDYGNTSHLHNRFPKFVKIHVVSIEESGKITYLDSSTKWYKGNNFYIQNQKEILDKPDLDSYRTMVSSAYSIFSSKVSGKLALLIELEKISGFSCTWNAYTDQLSYESDILANKYSIYWNFSWNTENFNVNPSAVVLTKSEWTGEDDTNAGFYLTWQYDPIKKGWALGGSNKEWTNTNISKPISYPNADYYYSSISRLYEPETYIKTFDSFIKTDSFYVRSASILELIKKDIVNNSAEINLPELTKVNIAKEKGLPSVGNYYFNCTSATAQDNIIKYYTNYHNKLIEITSISVSDDIINNTFNYPVTKKFTDFIIPVKLKVREKEREEAKNININNLIYYYELTPAMPYGLLREFSLDGYIDFKKIGTKSIKLDTWKYFNYENTSTLTWGLEAYTEPNKGISEVVFMFYDNLGPVAAYHSAGKSSYNGKFTEYFTLNTSGTNYKLNNKNENQKVFYHKGEMVSKDSAVISNTYLDDSGNVIAIEDMTEGTLYYVNDAGTLYSNCLYLVKTIVKYCTIGALGEYIEDNDNYIEDYRWYWTNVMFNDYYYSVLDFKLLLFTLNLDCQTVFETVKDKWEVKTSLYTAKDSFSDPINSSLAFKSLSATILYINLDNKQDNNIKMAVRAGLQYSYNTFNIEKEEISNIKAKIFLAREYLSNFPELPIVKFSEKETVILANIYPNMSKTPTGKVDETTSSTLNALVDSNIIGTGLELNETSDSYKNYTNNMHINSTKLSKKEGNLDGNLVYINSNGEEEILTNYELYNTTLDQIQYNEDNKTINNYYPITFSGIHYSKYYYLNKVYTTPANVLTSFVSNVNDLGKYAMSPYGTLQILYNRIMLISHNDEKNHNSRITGGLVYFEGNNCSNFTPLEWFWDKDKENISILSYFLEYYDTIKSNFKFLFPLGYGNTEYGWDKQPARKSTNNVAYSSNRRIEVAPYSDFDLGGTLTGITKAGVIEPGDHHEPLNGNWNALTRFIPITLGYLTLLFYISELSDSINLYYPSNYVFLDKNYTSYKRDIVVELSSNLKRNNDNDLLVILNKWKYSAYLELVVNNSLVSELLKNSLKEEINVSLKLLACLKTSPLELLFNYIPPVIEDMNLGNKTIIKSIYSDIPSLTSLNLLKLYIYTYDVSSLSFRTIRTTSYLYQVRNYTILGNTINATLANNKQSFGISTLNSKLEIVDNTLTISALPISSGTYKMNTSHTEDGRNLSDYKSNLLYFT